MKTQHQPHQSEAARLTEQGQQKTGIKDSVRLDAVFNARYHRHFIAQTLF